MLEAARTLGTDVDVARREHDRLKLYRFDPKLRLMSTVDRREDGGITVHVKGAPEEVLERSTMIGGLETIGRSPKQTVARSWTCSLATRHRDCACSRSPVDACRTAKHLPSSARTLSEELCLLGLVALFDPPRAEVAEAVARCHGAGIRILVVTGDYGPTAAEIARRVGIGRNGVEGGRGR